LVEGVLDQLAPDRGEQLVSILFFHQLPQQVAAVEVRGQQTLVVVLVVLAAALHIRVWLVLGHQVKEITVD
jgi:hypothetical protein